MKRDGRRQQLNFFSTADRQATMTEVLKPYADPAGADQILTDTERWLERAVIGLNLCPFAKSVFVKTGPLRVDRSKQR